MFHKAKLIATVKASFFNDNGEKQVKTDAQTAQEWQRIGKMFNISSEVAQRYWHQISDDYLNYLRRRRPEFRFAAEMQFMQMHLLRQRDRGDAVADLELDECELQRILNSDDETEATLPPPIKRKKTSTPPPPPPTPPHSDSQIKPTDLPSEPGPAAAARPSAAFSIAGGSGINNLSSLELIFLGYAKVLQKMPRPLQLATKRKIADIMDEAEMQLC